MRATTITTPTGLQAMAYNEILAYRPEVELLMVVSNVADKYILRWPEGRHELLHPLTQLLGDTDFIGPNAAQSGFHMSIVEFEYKYYWQVNKLVNEIGVFISWDNLNREIQ